jgi:hypothetical protein
LKPTTTTPLSLNHPPTLIKPSTSSIAFFFFFNYIIPVVAMETNLLAASCFITRTLLALKEQNRNKRNEYQELC